MIIAFPKEIDLKEKRIALTPTIAKKFIGLGFDVRMRTNLGAPLFFSDQAYKDAGVKIVKTHKELFSAADIILRLGKPSPEEINSLKPGSFYVSFLDPFKESTLVKMFAKKNINAISMEMIPRITKAQKMDALSSQASLAGYVAVILAAQSLPKIFPMQMTPAGTISPARVFIVGAGVAGLQAIATAKRLGARVEAFDTRPAVAEQVQSLGAKFVKIDLGQTGETKDGYAKQLTEEQIKKQRDGMAKACTNADVVITTAQVFGKKAPVIITKKMIEKMNPGSIIIDMAVETGGNVEGSALDEEVVLNGVRILGVSSLPSYVAVNASEMYANNIYNLIEELWDKDNQIFKINLENEIIKGCLLTYNEKLLIN
ncbi:MAG: Re/Si-specific NAD(P)(+) transhydrogenase subunit alpha [Candidatus Aceula meridiana]|nr:Re/Si-specific NAD(P)(+) transhydrogenase subunit alpha [Candidatus Aceula meridiana]